MAEQGIWIIFPTTPDGSKSSGYTGPDFSRSQGSPTGASYVETEVLKARMENFLTQLESLFDKAEQSSTKMQLDEIELAIEITGEGQIRLLGSGTTVGGTGSITLKFKRRDNS